MADASDIEWTDATWNVVRGCTRVSPGCGGPGPHGGCYAEGIAARFSGPGQPFEDLAEMRGGKPRWTGKVAFVEHLLTLPLRWKRPRRIFVNSMSDLFHEDVPDAWIDRIFAVMALCPQHTFQVLTKRSARMRAYLSAARAHPVGMAAFGIVLDEAARNPKSNVGAGVTLRGDIPHLSVWPLPNVWLGVSAEDQRRADERVPDLLATPAAVRFVSAEPLLGPLDLRRWLAIDWQCSYCRGFFTGWHRPTCPSCNKEGGWTGSHAFNGRHQPTRPGWPIDRGSGLDWIIVGGESGRNARPMHPDWVRSIHDQCAAASVPFFFKQWGEWLPGENAAHPHMTEPRHSGGPCRPRTVALWQDGGWGERKTPNPAQNYVTWEPDGTEHRGERIGGAYWPIAHWASRVGKKTAGRLLDGVEHNGMPQAAAAPLAGAA